MGREPFLPHLPTTMSSGELLLKLFDFFWFEHGVFSRPSPSSTTGASPALDVDEEVEPPPPKLSRTPTVMVRSFSDQALISKDESSSDSSSPISVLGVPKLQTILSGKEVEEFAEVTVSKGGPDFAAEDRESDRRRRRRRKGERKGSSRSLSELEYEELKGFIDLGFVFSDEDKASSLVSIIPGLQRLGRKDPQSGDKEDKNSQQSAVSRPYLSEAWDFSEKKKTENPLTNWRIPTFGNEMELKDHLKFWAHTVASTVR